MIDTPQSQETGYLVYLTSSIIMMIIDRAIYRPRHQTRSLAPTAMPTSTAAAAEYGRTMAPFPDCVCVVEGGSFDQQRKSSKRRTPDLAYESDIGNVTSMKSERGK
jgi:hypothetical protein